MSRRTMFAPIRPSPIIPSCMVNSLLRNECSTRCVSFPGSEFTVQDFVFSLSAFQLRLWISHLVMLSPKAETLPGTHWCCHPPGNGEAVLSVSSRYLHPEPPRQVREQRSGGLLRPPHIGATSSCRADLILECPRSPH